MTKDNLSGGRPYGFVLPDAGADATFVTTVALPFVSYLQSVFDKGGFPRWTGNHRQGGISRALGTADPHLIRALSDHGSPVVHGSRPRARDH